MIFWDCTRWGSQPIHKVMYEFEVDVITEVVDKIDVVLPLNFIDFFDIVFCRVCLDYG